MRLGKTSHTQAGCRAAANDSGQWRSSAETGEQQTAWVLTLGWCHWWWFSNLKLLGERNKASLKWVSWAFHLSTSFSLPYIFFCPHPKRSLVSSFPLIRSQGPMKIKAKITRNQKLDYPFFEGKEDFIFKSYLKERKYFHFIPLKGVVVLFLSMEGSLLDFSYRRKRKKSIVKMLC